MKLIDYIRGLRRGRGAHRTELEAMRDPLLGDALEGYDKVQGDHYPTLERLERRIAERARAEANAAAKPLPMVADSAPRRRLRRWSVAVAAAVIVFATGGIVLFMQRDLLTRADEPLVAQEIVKEAPEAGTPPADMEEEKMIGEVEAAKAESQKSTKKYSADISEPQISAEDEAVTKVERVVIEDYRVMDMSRKPAQERVAEPITEEAAAPETASALQGRTAGIAAKEDVSVGRRIAGRAQQTESASPKTHDNLADDVLTSSDAELNEVVVVGYGTRKRSNVTGAVETVGEMPADTIMTAAFRHYIAATAESGIAGSATLEFEVNRRGRPHRIETVESTSKEAGREAVRLLRNGPDWEQTGSRKRIIITFSLPEEVKNER